MAKPKSVTFKYEGEGPATIIAGSLNESVEPGDSVTSEDAAVVEALRANPDLKESKGKK